MNVNIPPDSEQWLFSPAPPEEGRLWSFRWPPPCEVGDELHFRFGGKLVARAIVYQILPPGDHDNFCHNGKRYLRGWKVVWLNADFEDLRDKPSIVRRLNRERRQRIRAINRDIEGELF